MFEEHFENLFRLLEVERQAEKEENKRELERYPLQVREALGKTATRLHIVDEDVGVGGLPLLILSKTVKNPGALSPFHAMNQGDNVLLTYAAGSDLPPVEGTLYNVEDQSVTVAIKGMIPNPLPKGLCQLDMLGSDATYKRMRQAMNQVMKTQKPDLLRLRGVLLGDIKPGHEKIPPFNVYNTALNEYQVQAVGRCLAAQDVAVIHGPPGTGKTTVLVEVIRQSVAQGAKVLASAPSNIAVDNMVEKLLGSGLRIVRTGHPARILEPLRHVTLSAQEEEHESKAEIDRMNEERHRLLNQLRRKESRGRGVTYDDKREMRMEIERLGKDAEDLEFAIRRQIIERSDVVLCTHGGIGGLLNRQKFDLVVMDEASQATEPLSWIPITYGKKVVFAGDTLQLPPTIYSKEAAEKGLARTMFERLKDSLPAELQSLLRVQYRMHEAIMGFSSEKFYEGKLIADESVRTHTADELPGVQKTDLTQAPVVYIDTAGTGYGEIWNELLESRENEGEAELALKILGQLEENGVEPQDIAIITPYVAQVKRLRLMAQGRFVEIGSVDSFQGREKEVVILSLVRSNETGEVGFLSDTRRMNVGMTRARRLLIVIGDSATISRHPFYNSFLEYVDNLDAHRSAWEWKDQ